MNTNGRPDGEIDLVLFQENQRLIDPDQLLPYVGQHIAWAPDGTHVVASAADRKTLFEQLKAAGISASHVVFDYVDDL